MTAYEPDAPGKTPQGAFAQSALPVRLIVMIIAVIFGAIGTAVAWYRSLGWDWWALLRDPATSMDFSPAVGVFSHLGVLAMAMAGAVCLFCATALGTRAKDGPVLLYAGVMSVWLAADDLFMLHETIFPRFLGIPEHVMLGAYVTLALGLLWLVGRPVFSLNFLGLWMATAFLGVMLVTDLAFHLATSLSFLVEEVAKQCGWMLWAAFWVAFAWQSAKESSHTA